MSHRTAARGQLSHNKITVQPHHTKRSAYSGWCILGTFHIQLYLKVYFRCDLFQKVERVMPVNLQKWRFCLFRRNKCWASLRLIPFSVLFFVLFNDAINCQVCDVDVRWMNEYEALVEWYWQGNTGVLEEKPIPVLLCPPQIPHGLS